MMNRPPQVRVLHRRLMCLLGFAIAAGASTAWAQSQAPCNPACGAGQVCIQGMCMVPAPPPAAAPAPPPPDVSQQPGTTGNPAPAPAPPPNGYPPPGYGYPQNGYPQNGYPPNGYPPNGYPPPGAYPPPPPGYYPPPANPYGYPPGAYGPPPPRRKVFLALPFIGFNSYRGNGGSGLDAGLRLGGMLGFRIGNWLSLNGELTLDFLNFKNVSPGDSFSEVDFVFAFSPLFHFPAGTTELVFGPKLGVWGASSNSTVQGLSSTGSATGVMIGVNAGLFFPVGNRLQLGLLIDFDVRSYGQTCGTTDGIEDCTSSNLPSSDKVLGVSGALLF